MKKKNKRHRIHRIDAGHVGTLHGKSWGDIKWYVPFVDNHAIMYHGHKDPNDHSDCSPKIFCCPKAALLYKQCHPRGIPDTAEWHFEAGKHLASWMGERGPRVYYFFFCDPDDGTLLRFCGARIPEVRKVLLKQRALDY